MTVNEETRCPACGSTEIAPYSENRCGLVFSFYKCTNCGMDGDFDLSNDKVIDAWRLGLLDKIGTPFSGTNEQRNKNYARFTSSFEVGSVITIAGMEWIGVVVSRDLVNGTATISLMADDSLKFAPAAPTVSPAP